MFCLNDLDIELPYDVLVELKKLEHTPLEFSLPHNRSNGTYLVRFFKWRNIKALKNSFFELTTIDTANRWRIRIRPSSRHQTSAASINCTTSELLVKFESWNELMDQLASLYKFHPKDLASEQTKIIFQSIINQDHSIHYLKENYNSISRTIRNLISLTLQSDAHVSHTETKLLAECQTHMHEQLEDETNLEYLILAIAFFTNLFGVVSFFEINTPLLIKAITSKLNSIRE